MKLLPFFLILAFENVSYADCVIESEATPESTCVVMERNEIRGVWFDLATADTLRRFKLEVFELREQIINSEQMFELQTERLRFFEEISKEHKEAIELIQIELDRSLQREKELKLKSNLWYKSPILWFVSGIVLSTIIYVSIIVGVN
jgi:hypothetical protein